MKRPRYFQWLDGELQGTVTTLVNITETEGEYFYNFADGESCNMRFIAKMTNQPAMLKNKFMVEIASPGDPWRFEEIKMGKFKNAGDDEIIDVPPLEDITGATGNGNELNVEKSKLGTKKYTPPRFAGPFSELPSLDDYFYSEEQEQVEQKPKFVASMVKKKETKPRPEFTPVQEPVQEEPVQVVQLQQSYTPPSANNTPRFEQADSKDPVRILAKTCKKHPTEIDLTITINLPSKSIYNIAASEFDNGGEKFVNYLIEDIDINEIISSLRESLSESYASSSDE